jgi:hypothetical protein
LIEKTYWMKQVLYLQDNTSFTKLFTV